MVAAARSVSLVAESLSANVLLRSCPQAEPLLSKTVGPPMHDGQRGCTRPLLTRDP
nr:hypothetical protein [Kibdelosporangium sp. MJ126-NF4]